jgi:hypothetical protein
LTSKDYLLRQIEMLGELLVAIRRLILGGATPASEIFHRLRDASSKGGMDLDLARAATPDTLRLLIAPSGEIEPGRCWLLAETLYLDGLQARQVGDAPRAGDSLRKAKMLFSLLAPMGAFLVGFPEGRERMEEIDALLSEDVSGDDLPGDVEERPGP